jgi:hypothetical protein
LPAIFRLKFQAEQLFVGACASVNGQRVVKQWDIRSVIHFSPHSLNRRETDAPLPAHWATVSGISPDRNSCTVPKTPDISDRN